MASSRSEDQELLAAIEDLTEVMRDVHAAELLATKRRYLFSFVRGMMQGLGVIVAAAVVIPLLLPVLLYVLQMMARIPFVGHAAMRVIEQVEQTSSTPMTVDR